MKPFRLTTILSVFAIVLVAGVAIGFPIAVERGAPFRIRTSECLICGRMQTIERRWKQSPIVTIEAHQDSLWMQPQIDSKHQHWWVPTSIEERSEWFGSACIGCGGGVGGVSSLHYLTTKKGDEVAEPLVQTYMQLVKAGDLESIRDFVRNDVQTALLDPPVQQPVAE